MYIEGLDRSDYTMTRQFNEDTQETLIKFNYNKTFKNKKVVFDIDEEISRTLYDVNRNIIKHKMPRQKIDVNTEGDFICSLSRSKKDSIQTLAIIILSFLLASIVLIFLFSIFAYSRYDH